MRTVSTATMAAWRGGIFTGANRPMVRATIQRLSVQINSFKTQQYSAIPLGQVNVPRELPNIKSVKWNRQADQAVATMSMELWNTAALPLGATPQDVNEFDVPGYFTASRGHYVGPAPAWAHTRNAWQDVIVPDRIIRTYEGYGFEPTAVPENDTHLYLSGTWLIDDVTFEDGLIRIEARDIGRALIDQVLAPPIVPMQSYPLFFEKRVPKDNPDIHTTTGAWFHPTFDKDVNSVHGLPNQMGHYAVDAFDGKTSTYWLSISYNEPDDEYSFGFIQGKFSSRTVSAIKLRTWGGPYLCYISVYAGGKWQGKQIVPYDPNDISAYPNGANIPFVQTAKVPREGEITIKLKASVANATKVRVAFTNLYDTGHANPYRFRMGLRDFQVSSQVTTTRDGGTHLEPKTRPPGYDDYADIVKTLLAYAGWHWSTSSTRSFFTKTDGARVTVPAPSNDPVLAGGRVWGDIQQCGTAGEVALGVNIWDKKPVLDGINYVKDLLGYIFYIDEGGGAVFRSPNIWSVGNWVGNAGTTVGRTTSIVEIRDDETMLKFSAGLSSRSIRERVFVANLAGNYGAVAKGLNPYPSGLRRVGGYTDQHFKTEAECRIMADLIVLRQLFTYRTDMVSIPGLPAIQVDDQVKLVERVSEEYFLHYVKSISMDFDMTSGRYTYGLGTHWLGAQPFNNWTFDPANMSAETKAYLTAMGRWHA